MPRLSGLRPLLDRLARSLGPARRELELVAVLNAVAESGARQARAGCLGCHLAADYAADAAAAWPDLGQALRLARQGAGYAAQGSRVGCQHCHLHHEALCEGGVYTLSAVASPAAST